MAINRYLSFFFFTFFSLNACAQESGDSYRLNSPDGKISVDFLLQDGVPFYKVDFNKNPLLAKSKMGFQFDSIPALEGNFEVEKIIRDSNDTQWTQVWGEEKDIRNHFNSLKVILRESGQNRREIAVVFKVFNSGLGFRFEIPEQPGFSSFKITRELTEFNFIQDFDAWWIPAYCDDVDSELLFTKSKLSALDTLVHTPLTMELGDSLFVSIHEAALVDYPCMTLEPRGQDRLACNLMPWSTGEKMRGENSLKTPWRTIQIAQSAGDLITSYLILNLNEPNKLEDVSWIKPGKYEGIWWGMHIKEATWESGPEHGAKTENVKKLMDFSAKNNISAVLVEGWNVGWANGEHFDYSKPYPDYNIEELSAYSKKTGVGIIAHNETYGDVLNYENQLDDALAFCRKYDIHYLKTGYVTKRPNGTEYQQGQYMVNHFNKVMEKTAESEIMLDVHEPVKATGLRRTYPNMMTREGARGMEYEAWSNGNPPSHTTILPFTRCLGGPLDYTPGIFDIWIENQPNHRVHTTLAKQLALYVVFYSPLQMVPDLPEHYEGNPAFKFVKDVPTDWEHTLVLNAKIGAYITTVRKDRNSAEWYLGSITNEDKRFLNIDLDFLDPDREYYAEIYADGMDASMATNPLSINIQKRKVDSETQLRLYLAPGGGEAIRFYPVD